MKTWTVMQMMSLWLVPLLLVAWAIIATASNRQLASGCGPAQPVGYDRVLQVVRERYARGEIGRDEFEHLVAELLVRS